jgi:regulator of sigma E protease
MEFLKRFLEWMKARPKMLVLLSIFTAMLALGIFSPKTLYQLVSNAFYFTILITVVVTAHEFGHFLVARLCGVTVKVFSIGFGPKIFGWQGKHAYYQVAAVPLGGYVKMKGEGKKEEGPDSYSSQPVWKRFSIISAGVIANLILAFVLLVPVKMMGHQTIATCAQKLTPNGPADKAGLKAKDIILDLDNTRITLPDDVVLFERTEGKPVIVRVKREGRKMEFKVVPEVIKGKPVFGIHLGYAMVMEKSTFSQAFGRAADEFVHLIVIHAQVFYRIFTGKVEAKKNVGGPISIFMMSGAVASAGLSQFLYLIALICIVLAIVNFLPLPVIDGGHAVLLIYEKIRGKPPGDGFMTAWNYFGICIIVLLTFLIFSVDISRFMGW